MQQTHQGQTALVEETRLVVTDTKGPGRGNSELGRLQLNSPLRGQRPHILPPTTHRGHTVPPCLSLSLKPMSNCVDFRVIRLYPHTHKFKNKYRLSVYVSVGRALTLQTDGHEFKSMLWGNLNIFYLLAS